MASVSTPANANLQHQQNAIAPTSSGRNTQKRSNARSHDHNKTKKPRQEEPLEAEMEPAHDILPSEEFPDELRDNGIDMPVDIGLGNREMTVDYSFNYKGLVIKKFSGDETRRSNEIHLSKKVCETLMENETDILIASQKIEMGEHTQYHLDLGNNFMVQAESDGGFDVTHIRKIIRPPKRCQYFASSMATSSAEPPQHSQTGLTFKFGEMKLLFTIIKRVIGMLVGF